MKLEDVIRQRLGEEAEDMPSIDETLSRFQAVQQDGTESRHQGRRFGGWVSVTAIAAVVLTISVGGVYLEQNRAAQPTGSVTTSPVSHHDRVQAQQILDHLANKALKSADISGFAGSSINIHALTLTIKWTDPVPADVQALAGTDPASGAKVSVVVVPYSQDQVEAASRRVFSSATSEGLVAPNVTGATSDGTGLRIEVRPADLERARSESNAFAELAGMPVQIVAGASEPPQG